MMGKSEESKDFIEQLMEPKRQMDITPKTTGLVILDCQEACRDFVSPSDLKRMITSHVKIIESARKAGILVIYVVVEFRDGYPEISPQNFHFNTVKEAGWVKIGNLDSSIWPEISPLPGDIVVSKRRQSAFFGTDLEMILRAKGIDTLILTGWTLGCVETTARQAFDMDYKLFVIADCCADKDEQANDIAMRWLLPRISVVCSLSDFEAAVFS